MNATGDSTKVAIKAATKTLTDIPLISNLAYTLSTWTAIFANINVQNKHEMKSSDNLPARIPGTKSSNPPRISMAEGTEGAKGTEGTAGTRAEPVALIAARISGSTGTTGSRGCRGRVCSNEHAWANAPA